MKDYLCLKCGRCFKKSSHLKNHLNKKIPCIQEQNINPLNAHECSIEKPKSSVPQINIKIYKCDQCTKEFTKKFNLNRHIPTCKVIKQTKLNEAQNILLDSDLSEQNNTNLQEINEIINNAGIVVDDNIKQVLNLILQISKKQIEIIKKENDEMKEKINILSTNTKKINKSTKNLKNSNNQLITTNCNNNSNNTNITNNTQNVTNNTINIVAHGKEDYSKIDLDTIMTCLSTFHHKDIIPNMTKHIFLNDDKPENKNFCVVDLARNKCKYSNGKRWLIGKTNDKIVKIFDNVHNMLTDPFEQENIEKTTEFIKSNPKKFNSTWIRVARQYLKSLYDEEDKENIECKAKVLCELKLIFFNNKDDILKKKH